MDALSTRDVPSRFLRAAFLVGRIPVRVAPEDPRASYGLYVPPTHYPVQYTADGDRAASLCASPSASPSASGRLPLVVWVHGTGRDTSALGTHLAGFCDAHGCAALAPLFPADMDGPGDLDAYKVLRSRTLRADRVLLAVLDAVAAGWPGIATRRVYLAGFSGGGQFAHRFLYLYPERVAAAAVGAPGRPTLLDATRPWPAGIADVEALFGRRVDVAAVARVPVHLVVGRHDTEAHGGDEFWAWARGMRDKRRARGRARARETAGAMTGTGREADETRETDEMQDTREDEQAGNPEKAETDKTTALPMAMGSRLASLQRLRQLWAADGIAATLEVVDGAAHQGHLLMPTLLAFIAKRLEADRSA